MANVVLTGPAHDAMGQPILRADLIEAAQAAGHVVFASMQHGVELLVASRTDTVKALKAAQGGIPVVDYPTFLAGLAKPPTAGKSRYKPDIWADPHVADTGTKIPLAGNVL
jgi:D-hexose-6-phosphate mutarotase